MLSTKLLALVSAQLFSTDFSGGTAGWTLFQEPISACYSTTSGSFAEADGGLAVLPNSGGSLLGNHLIAQRRLNDTGIDGVLTCVVEVQYVANTLDWLTYPETGPEISVQNTRQIADGGFITNTMGLQYVANPWNTHWTV